MSEHCEKCSGTGKCMAGCKAGGCDGDCTYCNGTGTTEKRDRERGYTDQEVDEAIAYLTNPKEATSVCSNRTPTVNMKWGKDYCNPREKPMCSDKQVIEDAVVEMAREVYRAAQSLDIESCSAGFHKCRVARGEIVFDALRVEPITIRLNANDEKYDLDGPAGWKCARYFKMAASGANLLQAQMKKDAKQLRKLANKLRPKVYTGRSFWSGPATTLPEWWRFAFAVSMGCLASGLMYLALEGIEIIQKVLDQIQAAQ